MALITDSSPSSRANGEENSDLSGWGRGLSWLVQDGSLGAEYNDKLIEGAVPTGRKRQQRYAVPENHTSGRKKLASITSGSATAYYLYTIENPDQERLVSDS